MGRAVPAPTARNGKKHVGLFGNKSGLKFRGEHQVAISQSLGCQGSENAAGDSKVGGSHVRAFFSAVKAQGYAAEISCIHQTLKPLNCLMQSNGFPSIYAAKHRL